MRTVLAVLLLGACAHTPHQKPVLGPVIGQSTAMGPKDPTHPLARDPRVTEGGGLITGRLGNGPGGVTPTVGEQPSTVDQTSGQANEDARAQQGGVFAPGAIVPPGTTTGPTTAPTLAPTLAPTNQTGAPAPQTPTVVPTTPAPATGPGAGTGQPTNGPGTGTAPATPAPQNPR